MAQYELGPLIAQVKNELSSHLSHVQMGEHAHLNATLQYLDPKKILFEESGARVVLVSRGRARASIF